MEFPERDNASEWCCGFFTDPKGAGGKPALASAHYAVDNNSTTQMVQERDVAWHAGPANGFSVGVEHAGYAKQTAAEWADKYSLDMLERSAELVAGVCHRYGIPPVRLTARDLAEGKRWGICGHADVTQGFGKGTHWDPGPNFPWDLYLDRVRFHLERAGEDTSTRLVEIPSALEVPDSETWPRVVHAGVEWKVAPVYVAPVGIGQAKETAAKLGCELPTRGLVDAIWRAADCKINGWDVAALARPHDGTPRTMNAPSTHARVAAGLERLVETATMGKPFRLLAGAFKDVIVDGTKVGLYGWHDHQGTPIQSPFFGHALEWCDYSQGLRLVKRV